MKFHVIKLMVLYSILWVENEASSVALKDLQKIIKMYVEIIPEENNEYFIKVSTSSHDIYRIYVYDSITNRRSKNSIVNDLNLFFIQINCKLADWTHYQLFSYVQRFPLLLFYNLKFDYKYNNLFDSDRENHKRGLTFIAKHVDTFVNLLHNFLDIIGPYYDTSLLKTLISLQFKIEYILFFVNGKEQSKVDKIIVNIIIEIMIDIQNFKTTNCPLQPKFVNTYPNYINEVKQFNGFWIQYQPMSKLAIKGY